MNKYIIILVVSTFAFFSCELPVNSGTGQSQSIEQTSLQKVNSLFTEVDDEAQGAVQSGSSSESEASGTNPENGGNPENGTNPGASSQTGSSGTTSTTGRVLVFETNNEDFLRPGGFTVWTETSVNAGDTFVPIRTGLTKYSGDVYSGYGIVFCCRGSGEDERFLVVMINSVSQYNVGKVCNGRFEALVNWTFDSHIVSGLGNENVLFITYDAELEKYVLTVNGHEAARFSDADFRGGEFAGCRSGYSAVIAPNEDFRNSTVKVRYRDLAS